MVCKSTATPTGSPSATPTTSPTQAPTTVAPTPIPTTGNPTMQACKGDMHGCNKTSGGTCIVDSSAAQGWRCACKSGYYCKSCGGARLMKIQVFAGSGCTGNSNSQPSLSTRLDGTCHDRMQASCVNATHVRMYQYLDFSCHVASSTARILPVSASGTCSKLMSTYISISANCSAASNAGIAPECALAVTPTAFPSKSSPTGYPTTTRPTAPCSSACKNCTLASIPRATCMAWGLDCACTPAGQFPTTSPTDSPTNRPTTGAPSQLPTNAPTTPSKAPTLTPTLPGATRQPTALPSSTPSASPSTPAPSSSPTAPTISPTSSPTCAPACNACIFSGNPLATCKAWGLDCSCSTSLPTSSPTLPTIAPTPVPVSTSSPTQPTSFPTSPTARPTDSPTTNIPTAAPSSPTRSPSSSPSGSPTEHPTSGPTFHPCTDGSHSCDKVSGGICINDPSAKDSWRCACDITRGYYCSAGCDRAFDHVGHTCTLSKSPTLAPTSSPTTGYPTTAPSVVPTASPSRSPTLFPTRGPTKIGETWSPTASPTVCPTEQPLVAPESGDLGTCSKTHGLKAGESCAFTCSSGAPDPLVFECGARSSAKVTQDWGACQQCCTNVTKTTCRFTSFLTPEILGAAQYFIMFCTIIAVLGSVVSGAIAALAPSTLSRIVDILLDVDVKVSDLGTVSRQRMLRQHMARILRQSAAEFSVHGSGPCVMLCTVQLFPFIAMIDMPLHSMYREFLASFAIFNGQFRPPSIVTQFMSSEENPCTVAGSTQGIDAFLEVRGITADNLLIGNLFWLGAFVCAMLLILPFLNTIIKTFMISKLGNRSKKDRWELPGFMKMSRFLVSTWYISFDGLIGSSLIVLARSERADMLSLAFAIVVVELSLVALLICYVTILLSEKLADRRMKGEPGPFFFQSLYHGGNHKMYNRVGEAYAEKRPQNYMELINSFDNWWDVKPLRNFEAFKGQVWLTPSSEDYLMRDVPLSREKEIVFSVTAMHNAQIGFYKNLSGVDTGEKEKKVAAVEASSVKQADLRRVDTDELEQKNRSRASNKALYEIIIGASNNTRSEIHVHGNLEAFTTAASVPKSKVGVYPQVSSDPDKKALLKAGEVKHFWAATRDGMVQLGEWNDNANKKGKVLMQWSGGECRIVTCRGFKHEVLNGDYMLDATASSGGAPVYTKVALQERYCLFYRKTKSRWAIGIQEGHAGACDITLAESGNAEPDMQQSRKRKWKERSLHELAWESNSKARVEPRFDEVNYAGLMTKFDERDLNAAGNLGQWTVSDSPETKAEKRERLKAGYRLDTFGALFEAYTVEARCTRLVILCFKCLFAACLAFSKNTAVQTVPFLLLHLGLTLYTLTRKVILVKRAATLQILVYVAELFVLLAILIMGEFSIGVMFTFNIIGCAASATNDAMKLSVNAVGQVKFAVKALLNVLCTCFSGLERELIEATFNEFDTKGSGLLGRDEVRAMCQNLGISLVDDLALDAVMEEMELGRKLDGVVSLSEMLRWWNLRPELHDKHDKTSKKDKRKSKDVVADLFAEFDTDGSGTLDKKEVQKVFETLGHPKKGKGLDIAMTEIESGGTLDGKIEFSEFLRWWKEDSTATVVAMAASKSDSQAAKKGKKKGKKNLAVVVPGREKALAAGLAVEETGLSHSNPMHGDALDLDESSPLSSPQGSPSQGSPSEERARSPKARKKAEQEGSKSPKSGKKKKGKKKERAPGSPTIEMSVNCSNPLYTGGDDDDDT